MIVPLAVNHLGWNTIVAVRGHSRLCLFNSALKTAL